ncbi:hypothetical protein A1332_14745 [Methylomonas methanica]|uniref:DUF898 domain-containing protein n=2 Tax=Methylomonas methanica TaxID=421 RepID=A0A177MFW2_METMH|nr:hypothetical protein A1332_14745 [Methylomonas methanica]
MQSHQYQPLRFTGNGGEYFRIWIVNLCLSIVTFGIYSGWAKVRRNQYFYRHTYLANANFDYHGNPIAILKGRIFAFVLFAAYSITIRSDLIEGLIVLVVIMLIMPWLLVSSLRFRLHNTSYRGLRFSFHGETGEAYISMLLWPLFSFFTLGMLWPFAHQRIASYMRENSVYGNVFFKFAAGVRRFYKLYGVVLLITIVNVFIAMTITRVMIRSGALHIAGEKVYMVNVAVGISALWAYIGLLLVVAPYFISRMQNLLWNQTKLGSHIFTSEARARELFVIMLGNVVLITLTLGLFKPFADIRLARYRLERIGILLDGDIDQFTSGLQGEVAAIGEEVADMFDVDIAL